MLYFDMRYSNIREAIEELRKEERLSIPEMAKRVGMSYPGLRKIIIGETQNVQEATVRSIAEAFNREIIEDGDLVYFEKSKPIPQNELRPDMKEIYDLLMRMPEKKRESILEFLKGMVDDLD